MKKILFLLLLTCASYAQTSTGQEQSFDYGIKNNSTQTVINPNMLVTEGADGTYGKVSVNNVPISIAVRDSLNKKLNLPTGFLQGLQLSINADPTKYNIAAGYYVITDFTNLAQPVVKIITYPGATGITPTYLASANSTYVALDKNMNIISSASPFTDAQRRTLAIIGNVVHSNHTTINVTNEIKAPIVALGNQLHDFMKAIGFLNESGNIYSPNGANLQLNKSAGDIFGMGINSADYLNPHKLTIAAQTALTFAYRFQNGTQLADTQNVNPNIYDVGGVNTATPTNKWTIQRINLFQSGLARIQPGQTVYNSFIDATTALPTQPFVTEQNIADNAVFRCYLIVQQGTTNLASAVADGTAQFVPVDKFGNVIGNGSVALTYANIIAALGYTPENSANKSDSYTASSSTTFSSTKALVDGLNLKLDKTDRADSVTNAITIAGWGDSLTAGAPTDLIWLNYLSDLTGYSNYNGGVGGETSTQIKTRMLAATDKYNYPTIIWAGNNNYLSPSTIKSDIAAMVAALGHSRYLIISLINGDYPDRYIGQPGYDAIIDTNNYLATTYGSRYVDVRSMLVAAYNPAIPQDVIDHGRDIVPSSLRVDAIHLTAHGYSLVADKLALSANILSGTDSLMVTKNIIPLLSSPPVIGAVLPNKSFFTSIVANNTVWSKGNVLLGTDPAGISGILINPTTTTKTIQSYGGGGLAINPAGDNVLIGTSTNSTYKLDVNGTFRAIGTSNVSKIDGKLNLGASATDGIIIDATPTGSSTKKIQTYSAPLSLNGLGNNVLIGTDINSSYTLDVNGTIRTNNNFYATGTVELSSGGINGMVINATGGSGIVKTIQTYGSSALALNPLGSNILIGTSTNGSDKLDVNGTIRGTVLKSTTATGTAPFTVTSTTVSTNLNADLLDGQHGTYFAPISSPTFTGTPTAPTAIAGTNTTQIATTAFVTAATGNYKKYVAILNQVGTAAPTATVLENTLGGTVVWTRTSTGTYAGTLSSAFVSNKTWAIISATGNGWINKISRNSANDVTIQTSLQATNNLTDDALLETAIEIRVYN